MNVKNLETRRRIGPSMLFDETLRFRAFSRSLTSMVSSAAV
jgi:hypothetical protein